MHAEDIEAFFPKPTSDDKKNNSDQKEETTKSKPSKRKRDDDQEDEKEQIRKQCKYYCGSPAEWNIVRKYKFERQKEYVEEKRFLEEKQLSETVFNATHNCLGVVLDYVTQGDGYVENEIKNDLSLRHAIEEEFQNILYLFNNKIKILFLTSIDELQHVRRPRVTRLNVSKNSEIYKKRSTNTRLKPELKPRLKPRLKTDLKTLLITNMTSVMKT